MYIDYYFKPSDASETEQDPITITPLQIEGSDGMEPITVFIDGFKEESDSNFATKISNDIYSSDTYDIVSSDFSFIVNGDTIVQTGYWQANNFPGVGNVSLVKGNTTKSSFSLRDLDFSIEYDVMLTNDGEVGIVFGYDNYTGNYKAINLLIDSSNQSNNGLRLVDVTQVAGSTKYADIVSTDGNSNLNSSNINNKLVNFKIERTKGDSVLDDAIKATVTSSDGTEIISHNFNIVENLTITTTDLSLDDLIKEVKEDSPLHEKRFSTEAYWKSQPDINHVYSVIYNDGITSETIGRIFYAVESPESENSSSINKWIFIQDILVQDSQEKNLSVRMELTGEVGFLVNGTNSGISISNMTVIQKSQQENNVTPLDTCYQKKRFCICIPNGNYVVTNNGNNSNNINNLMDEINENISVQFTNNSDVVLSSDAVVFSYDQSTHKTTITNNHTYQNSFFEVIFYDSEQPFCNSLQCMQNSKCTNCSCVKYSKLNSNLGWNLGFRPQEKLLDKKTNVKFSIF